MSESDRPHGPGQPAREPRPAQAGAPTPIRAAMARDAEPKEPAAESAPGERRFDAGGETWIARPAGESAIGHGAGARAYLVAVRFYRPGDHVPVSEVLIPRGRFEALYDEELAELLGRATPLEPPREPEPEPRRAGAEQDEAPPEG